MSKFQVNLEYTDGERKSIKTEDHEAVIRFWTDVATDAHQHGRRIRHFVAECNGYKSEFHLQEKTTHA